MPTQAGVGVVATQARQILNDYRLERILRSTVWTTVLRALEPRTERPVVIKLIHPAGPVAEEANRSRFAQLMGDAQRGLFRGLPRVLDFGFTPEHHAFLVSEPVDGGVSLSGLRSAPTSFMVAALVAVVDAVDELAMAGLAHLNLSLDNVLVMDRSVRVVGNGTGAYLLGAPSRVWPPEGARGAAPELYGRGVLRRDDLWLADLYAIAVMACDALGAEVEGMGTREPSVRLDRPGFVGAEEFAAVAAAALRRDPAARGVSLSELRAVLARGVLGEGEEAEREALTPLALGGESGVVDREVPAQEATPRETLLMGPAVTPPPTRRHSRRLTLAPWTLVAAAMATAVLGGVTTLTMLGRTARSVRRTRPTPAVAEVVVVPPATPTAVPAPPAPAVVADPRLEQAERLLTEGDRDGARAVLDGISDEELGRLSPAELDRYEELTGDLETMGRDVAMRDLRGGLEAGSIAMVRRAVAALGDLEPAELASDPDLGEDLDHARAALSQHRELWDADRAGDRLQVVAQARRMIALLPGYSGAYRMREEAAAALESEATAAAARGELDEALALMRSLQEQWPERPGLGERIAAWQGQRQRQEKLAEVLGRALAAGRSGQPDAGLRLLAAAEPGEAYAERFQKARADLEAELARLDASSPQISLPPELELRYRKNETVALPLTVTDDFRVEQVVAHVKREREAGYRDLLLERGTGDLYELRITPEIHGNDKVLFWVEAVDTSSHRGTLGDAAAPLVLERKRWYQK